MFGRIRRVFGCALMGLGLMGMLLPLMPGVPLLLAGVALLGANHPLVRPLIERRRRRAKGGRKRRLKQLLQMKLRGEAASQIRFLEKEETMKERCKWTLAAFGVLFGTQVLFAMLLTGLASWSGAVGGVMGMMGFVGALAAFLLGGFIIGNAGRVWRTTEVFIAAVLTLGLAALIYDPAEVAGISGFALSGLLVDPASYGVMHELFIALGVLAAVVGAFIGYERAKRTGSAHETFTLFLGLAVGTAAPLLLVGGALAWQAHWLIAFATTVVVAVSFVYARLGRSTSAAQGHYIIGCALTE